MWVLIEKQRGTGTKNPNKDLAGLSMDLDPWLWNLVALVWQEQVGKQLQGVQMQWKRLTTE